MSTSSADPSHRFSLVVGGPFHSLLGRVGWLAEDGLPRTRAAVTLALIVWSVPALFAVAQSLLDAEYSGWSYFADKTAIARYLVAVFVMVATERFADSRFRLLFGQFQAAQIVVPGCESKLLEALAIADRRSSSILAECVIAAIALLWAATATRIAAATLSAAWEGTVVPDGIDLSWAGTVASVFSTPLFLFLTFRWLWRSVVWTFMLFRLSRLPLRLTPLHPDRCGGLGFLAVFPGIFTGFVFALSCCVAATLLRESQGVNFTLDEIRWMIAGWLILILVLFVGPLAVFVPILRNIREEAWLEYGPLVHRHHLVFRHRWIESEHTDEELMASHDSSSVADLNVALEVIHEMQVFPIDRFALLQLLGAAAIPMLAVVLNRIPLADLLKRALGLGLL